MQLMKDTVEQYLTMYYYLNHGTNKSGMKKA